MINSSSPAERPKTRKHKIFIIGSNKNSTIKQSNPQAPVPPIQAQQVLSGCQQQQLRPAHRRSIFEQLPPKPRSYSTGSMYNKVYSYNIKNHITAQPLCNPVRCNLTNDNRVHSPIKNQQTTSYQNHSRTSIFKIGQSLLQNKIVNQNADNEKTTANPLLENSKLTKSIIQNKQPQTIIERSHSCLNVRKKIFFNYPEQPTYEYGLLSKQQQRQKRIRIFPNDSPTFRNTLQLPKHFNPMEAIKQQWQRQTSRIKESNTEKPLSIVINNNSN